MANHEFFTDILEKAPPYKNVSLTVRQWEKLMSLGSFAIEMYCENCQKIRSFKHTKEEDDINDPLFEDLSDDIFEQLNTIRNQDKNTPILSYNHFIDVELYCAHCEEKHKVSFMCTPKGIMKYGQYPSFASEEEHELVKYKNIISKYYIELIRSVRAYSQGMGIAAFVYLRRIFEHLVEKEFAAITTPIGNEKFDDKMKKVDKEIGIIPEELDRVKSKIYSVLSKGVHEYEESECLELYPYLKIVVIEILEKYYSKKEREKRLKEASKMLDSKIKEEK